MNSGVGSPVAVMRGVYPAGRAAALAGVPASTVYGWARTGVLLPSVSTEKLKLWSWADLVALRAVYWLRHPVQGEARRPTRMPAVRELIRLIEEESGSIGDAVASGAVTLYTSARGDPYLQVGKHFLGGRSHLRQLVIPGMVIDLLAPFAVESGLRGPHLLRPREGLRIIPGKLSGEPHIENTRIETLVLWSLHQRGYSAAEIAALYGDLAVADVESGLALERQLEQNRRAA